MIPETLAADIPRLRLSQLHQQIAQALEQLHPDDLTDYLPQLAEHYARSITGRIARQGDRVCGARHETRDAATGL